MLKTLYGRKRHSAIFCSRADSLCSCRMWFRMSDFPCAFWISTEALYLQRCLVVTWLMPRKTAAVSAHVLCIPYRDAPAYDVTWFEVSCVVCIRFTAITWHLHFGQNDRDLLRAIAVTVTHRGGGIAVIYKDILHPLLSFRESSPFAARSSESVEFLFKQPGQSIIFTYLYRPPPSRQNKLTVSLFHSFVCDEGSRQTRKERTAAVKAWQNEWGDQFHCSLGVKIFSDRTNSTELVVARFVGLADEVLPGQYAVEENAEAFDSVRERDCSIVKLKGVDSNRGQFLSCSVEHRYCYCLLTI